MTPQDQWYYLDGSESRGPVPSSQIVQLIRAGSLSPATQVAQAGWPQWSPASTALANLLGVQQQPGPMVAAPVEAPTYAIQIHCISGPDSGKAYMVGASEVSLGRVSGIGQADPQIAENHVALSWQNNVLHFRTFGGARLRVAGMDVTQGALSNGQQFQMGLSTWQVGAAPVELTNLLGSLASRLNKLTSTEKLEGFSLTGMFSEVFKGRKPGEIEDYFVVGTTKTTPPIDEVQTGWPKPWFFMRVLIFMAASYFILQKILDIFSNVKVVPGLMMVGSMAVPLATAILLWELNSPRNVSFVQVLTLFCLGGVISLFFTLIGYEISNLGWLGTPSAGIIEEIGKVLTVMVIVRNVKYRYTLNGIVFGAAIGAGFAAFESAGYAFEQAYLLTFTANAIDHIDVIQNVRAKLSQPGNHYSLILSLEYFLGGKNAFTRTFNLIATRAYLAPFGHVIWTAIAAGALWRVKGADPLRFRMLFDPKFMRTFLVPVVLHMLWDTDFPIENELLQDGVYLLLGFIGWYVAFLLVQQGLHQVRDEQLAYTRTEMNRTQQILTTTGKFRAAQGLRPS